MVLAKKSSRESAFVDLILAREPPVLKDPSSHLSELDAQAREHLDQLKKATKAAHDRIDAGLSAVAPPARAAEPEPADDPNADTIPIFRGPLVQMSDFDAQP